MRKNIMSGISSKEIERFIRKHGGKDMIKEFLGVYAAKELKEINIKKFRIKITDRVHRVPFCVANTDPIEENGQHWIGIFNICPDNNLFIFDSYGEAGFKEFIESDDEEIIGSFFSEIFEEDVKDTEYFGLTSSIVDKTVQFNAREYNKNLSNKNKKQLTPSCRGLFELFVEFAKASQHDSIICHFIDDQLQESNTQWCGIFILYFAYNLYNPILSRLSNKNANCSMRHIKMTMDEIFNRGSNSGRRLNSVVLQNFVKDYKIKGDF